MTQLKDLKYVFGIVCISFLLMARPGFSQFRVFSWDSFEGAEDSLPDQLRFGHYANTNNVSPVRYDQLPDFLALRTPLAVRENGTMGLRLEPNTDRPHLSVVNKSHLERARLGAQGSAVIQADFYVPEIDEPWPNFAMLASHQDPEKPSAYRMYRFGITGEQLYFSYLDGGTAPKVYVRQRLSELNLQLPGWHRFQIIFHGQNQIFCAIDGQMTSFSPVEENTLTRLAPGIMVTKRKDVENEAVIADNISIQWTPQPVSRLPLSPWTQDPSKIAVLGGDNPRLMEPDSSVVWRVDPGAAWQEVQQTQKPMLVLFYVPQIPSYDYLVDLCPDNDPAGTWFQQFVPLRVDTDQLKGGQLAKKFGVFRVPTLLVLDTNGKEQKRLVVIPDKTQWSEVLALGN